MHVVHDGDDKLQDIAALEQERKETLIAVNETPQHDDHDVLDHRELVGRCEWKCDEIYHALYD